MVADTLDGNRTYRVVAHAVNADSVWSATPTTTTFAVPKVTVDPPGGVTVFGTETLAATIADPTVTATTVEFLLDNTPIGTDTTPADGWTAPWDTTTATPGTHTLTARAVTSGGAIDSPASTVSVDNTLDGVTRVQTDRQRHRIDLDQWALWSVMAVFDHPDLPTRYRITATTITTGTDTDTATGHSWILDTVAQQWDDLEPQTRDTIEVIWANPESPTPGTTNPPPEFYGCPEDGAYVLGSVVGVSGPWCYVEFDYDPEDAIPTLGMWWKTTVFASPVPVPCSADPNDQATSAVNPLDVSPANGIPDQVDSYAQVLDAALATYLSSQGGSGDGYILELGGTGPLDVVIHDLGRSPECRLLMGIANAHKRWVTLDPEADAQVVAHEAYHLVQDYFRNGLVDGYADPYEDKGYTEYPEWSWSHESTAEWAPAYYANVTGTALHDLLDDPEPAWASPTNDLWGPSTRGFYDTLDTLRIRPPTLWAGPHNGLVAETYGSAPFWQYLAERYSDPTIGGDDIVLDYWHQLRDHHHLVDDGATFEALDEILPPDEPLTDAVRDFWASLYLLSGSSTTPLSYQWTLASSSPTAWRQRLAQSSFTALHADTFGAERPMASGPVVLHDNDTETQAFAVLPGGATFIDVDFQASISNLKVHVDSSDPVTVTAINYDGSHPNPCTVGSVIVHWEDDEDKELEHCRVLTIAVVAPEPLHGTNPALTTGTITLQTLGGTS